VKVARRRDHEAIELARGEALEQARRAEATAARLAAAVDALDDAVLVAGPSGEIVLRNAAAARFDDARHADALARSLLDELLGRALAGERVTRELSLFGPPREVLSVQAIPLGTGDHRLGAVAVVRDVTERKRVESVRRDFVANVSHELKTPIGALALLAETIAEGSDPEEMRGLADRLVREADRLSRIVDDLLDLSLIEAQEAPTRERVPVRVVIEEAVERVRAVALARNITLHEEPVADDLAISCDPAQMVAALTNLLDNAVKYSDAGRSVRIGARGSGARVSLEVSDQGIGIPPRDLERIFERFYRVDKARSRVTGGTGLGLSIVRHVAQAHGGDVSVESREGEGSTFRLDLPVAADAPAGAQEAP